MSQFVGDKQPLRDVPRLLDASSTDPLLRDALRVVRADTPDLASLSALADSVQRGVQDVGAPATAASAGSGIVKTVLAAVVACAGAYGAYRLTAPAPERAAAPPALEAAPPAPATAPGPGPAHAHATVREQTAPPSSAPNLGDRPKEEPGHVASAASAASGASAVSARRVPAARPHAQSLPSERTRAKLSEPKATAVQPSPERPDERSEAQLSEPGASESEVTLLETAQRMLQSNPAGALERLAEHRERFPTGSFAQEREALFVDALQRVGRSAEMRTRAAAFLERWPQSPHRARIQRLLDGD